MVAIADSAGVAYDFSMVTRALHILMVATLLACPLLCQQGLCYSHCPAVAATGAACTPSCCKKCDLLGSDESSPAQMPVAPAHAPCDDCRGICGGAIPVDSVAVAGALQLTPAFDALLAPRGIEAAIASHRTLPAPDEPDGLHQASGRVICCLHSSYLL